ncbi:Fe-Mn family superoxide dismutase [Blastomyces dermatitidis ATCC 18188]|uniref:Fe-Mn family superoxide dismutase n=1 Tax=Ajellomyces dermatitidis (strain ATCC 18188 / CBS 674.68) TaxID=653446 RepID=F2TGP5_AJEDA|nr:Fe-Mn family superoxide dismutase [Blastomyces dermatitidis ATCC 18188]
MILQRSLRPQSGLRAVSSSLYFLRTTPQTRSTHYVPQLGHDASFKQHGVPDLLSPQGFDLSWVQYQSFLINKLNLLTAGTPDESATPGTLLVRYARDASMASVFNYASMAHNNHFFFNCLSPEQVPIPEHLSKSIEDSCSSVESLKAEFLATANAMFGPGFVWLVKSKDTGQLKILSTYIAGSPYPAAHFRRQPVDMATQTTGITGGENLEQIRKLTPTNRVGSMGAYSSQKFMAPGAIDIHPILCVNTWEHVWLPDWGVGGKPQFLEAWWNRINWDEVAHNASQAGPISTRPGTARSSYRRGARF